MAHRKTGIQIIVFLQVGTPISFHCSEKKFFERIFRPHPFTKMCEKGCGLTYGTKTKKKPWFSKRIKAFGAAIQIRTGTVSHGTGSVGALTTSDWKNALKRIYGWGLQFFCVKKKNHRINDAVAFLGAAIQIRTGDLILTKDALYLLSYSSISDSFCIISKNTTSCQLFFWKLFLQSQICWKSYKKFSQISGKTVAF